MKISMGVALILAAAPLAAQEASLADVRIASSAAAPVLTVQEAIVLALQNNPGRQQAKASLAAAQARTGTAKSAGGPQVGLGAAANWDKNFDQPTFPGGGVAFTNNGINETASINGSLPIYTGGRVKAGTRQAEAMARVQAANVVQVEQDIVYNAAVGYLAVLKAGQLLEVATSDLAVSTERQRISKVRFDAGAAAKLDVLRADGIVADSKLRRINAANYVALTQANLNTQLGRAPEAPLRLVSLDSVEAASGEPSDSRTFAMPLAGVAPEKLRGLAEKNRPALLAAQEQVHAALAGVDVAKAQTKPNISATLSGIFRNPITFLGRFALSAGLSVAQTLFDSGRAKSQIAEAQSLTEQARKSQDGQRQQIAFQLEQQLLAMDAAQRKLDSTDANIKVAIEALRAAQVGYAGGARTSVEVSDSQTALLAAQTEAINARFDLANARAQLASSAGMLTKEWQVAYEAALREEVGRIRKGNSRVFSFEF